MTERPAKASEIATEYGFSTRYWIKLAAGGKIPGARQPSGPGGAWVFDMREFRLWWAARAAKEATAWPVYTGAERRGGAAFKEAARSSVAPSKRDLKASLASVLRNGSTG